MSNRGSDSTNNNTNNSSDAKRNSLGSGNGSSAQRKPVVGAPSTTTPTNRNSTSSTSLSKPAPSKPAGTTPTAATSAAAASVPKNAGYVPQRTNSAPPDEHPTNDANKTHFQPTKTGGINTVSAPTTGEHSYRSALGIKTESKDTQDANKPKVVPPATSQVTPADIPAAAPKPEEPTAVVEPVHEPAPILSDPSAPVVDGGQPSQFDSERSPQQSGYGESRDHGNNRNSTRNSTNAQSNPRRNHPRSDSYDRNASNSNRSNRNSLGHQQQTQPAAAPQMYPPQTPVYSYPAMTASYAQQPQQQYYAAPQMTQEQYAYYQANPAAYAQYYNYYQQQLYAAQVQQMYSRSAYPQYTYQMTPGMQYSTGIPTAAVYNPAAGMYYSNAVPQYQQQAALMSQMPKAPIEENPQQITPIAATNPITASPQFRPESSPFVPQNSQAPPQPAVPVPATPSVPVAATVPAPVVQSSPVVIPQAPKHEEAAATTSTPVSTVSSAPSLPAPATTQPPQTATAQVPIVPPERKKLKITLKTGEAWDPSKVQPRDASTQAASESAKEGDQEIAVKSETESQKPEVKAEVSVPHVEEAIPDIPVSVNRPKKAKAEAAKELEEIPVTVDKPKDSTPGDSWEDGEIALPVPVAEPEKQRRLVSSNKFNQQAIQKPTAKGKTYVYTKQEIMNLKPDENSMRMGPSLFGSITVLGESNTPTSGGGYGSGKQSGFGGKHGGRGGPARSGGNEYRGDQSPVGGQGGDSGWTREALPPQQQKKKAAATPVPPKKKEVDPMEIFKDSVRLILNKIAPTTFEKLSQQLLALQLQNTQMLDALVELIFEKAIYDPPAFTPMYADLCLLLKEKSNWVFFIVAKFHEANEYFWIRDFTFPDEAAGPYFSQVEAINAFNTEVLEDLPSMKPFSTSANTAARPPEVLLVRHKHLLKLTLNMSDQWYVTYVPIDNIPSHQRAQNLFPSEKDAHKDAVTELSFRGRLAYSCELEFEKSVKDESLFEQFDEELNQLRNKVKQGTLSPEDFELQETSIVEKLMKIKRRMIGNIRFVGELYKKKLLNTETMHDCILELLGRPPAWKQSYDEQELELLCDLLETIGETLETKTKKLKGKEDYKKYFDLYFDRLKQLSKDKNIISRLRFKIESIIDLRNNNWQKRRPQDAPTIVEKEEPAGKASAGRGAPAPAPSQQRTILSRSQDVRSQDVRTQEKSNVGRDSQDNRDSGRLSSRFGGSSQCDDSKSVGTKAPVDDKRPSLRSEPPKGTKGPAGASSSSGPSEDLEKIQFTDPAVRRGVTASIDEVLSGVELAELKATLKESSPAHTGYFIQMVLEKYANGNSSIREKLLAMFDDNELINWLASYSGIVAKAVETFEPLNGLVDTVVDLLKAPEYFGICLDRLIRVNVLTHDRVMNMVEKWKNYNLESGFTQEEVDKVFQSFLAKLTH